LRKSADKWRRNVIYARKFGRKVAKNSSYKANPAFLAHELLEK